MTNTEINLNQAVPQLFDNIKTKPISLPLDVEKDLKNIPEFLSLRSLIHSE